MESPNMRELNVERPHQNLRCRTVSEWLPAYVRGQLPPQARTRIARHIGGCPRCAVELADLRHLAAAIDRYGPVVLEDHPEAAQLVEYAWNEEDLDWPRRYRIIRHLALCSTCRAEVKILRHLNESLVGASGDGRTRTAPSAPSPPETSTSWPEQTPRRRRSIWIMVLVTLFAGGVSLFALHPWTEDGRWGIGDGGSAESGLRAPVFHLFPEARSRIRPLASLGRPFPMLRATG
ncbi:MAG: hypothetical protein D6723_16270 [Acidobacteria bacterium]|nr:MAG: hypothetical protein D6723_16270 [Acidobacteriota bacterium]